MAQHAAILSANCHEPKHMSSATGADAGKVLTPSAAAGLSELRLLVVSEISGLVAALAAKASLTSVETLTNKRITPRVSSVAYAASIDVNSDSFDVLACDSLTGNILINAPTGTPTDGQRLVVRLTQDGTGSHTVTFNAVFKGATAVVGTLSTSSTHEFLWHAARAAWVQVAATVDV